MDYKDWVILKTIGEEKNLTRTAEQLFLSQPALSYRLQTLEKSIGVKLLHRHPHGVQFTPQGEYLLNYAREMLSRYEEVKRHIRSMDTAIPQGVLRLGVSSVVAKFKMASLLKSFHKQFPEVQINLKTGSSALELPEMLRQGTVDILLLRGDSDWPEAKHVIAAEPMCIASSQPVELERLPQMTLIQYETSRIAGSEQQLAQWWQQQFSVPLPAPTKVDSIEACLQLVSHGFGWCVVPRIHVASRRLCTCPVTWRDGRVLQRRTYMLYRHETAEQPACQLFIKHVLHNYS
ncbi:MAG: LysR family transcriptional regulator [Sporomusaceae bacterium]|nr:LysR family transcriptional regulator [Sporomusaceae bacterium]